MISEVTIMLQLGTKVKIREDLAVGKLYFGDNNSLLATRLFTSNMSYYKGQIAEIIAMRITGNEV
jgi:hypothetical protein